MIRLLLPFGSAFDTPTRDTLRMFRGPGDASFAHRRCTTVGFRRLEDMCMPPGRSRPAGSPPPCPIPCRGVGSSTPSFRLDIEY